MADPRQPKQRNPAAAAQRSQAVELDRIELPPEAPAPPEAAPAADTDVPPEKPVAVSGDEEKPPPGQPSFPTAMRTLLVALAGVAAAIWIFVGAVYFFEWLFSR